MFYVYELLIAGEQTPFYVGMTSNVEKRLAAHLREGKRYSVNKRWVTMNEGKLKKIVSSNFEIQLIIVASADDKNTANQLEMDTIAKYGRNNNGGILTNMTDGGTGGYLVPQSSETARKKSEAMKKRIAQMSVEQLQEWKDARGKGRSRAWAKLNHEEKLEKMKSGILSPESTQKSLKHLEDSDYYQDESRKKQRSIKAKLHWQSLSENEKKKRLNKLAEGKKNGTHITLE